MYLRTDGAEEKSISKTLATGHRLSKLPHPRLLPRSPELFHDVENYLADNFGTASYALTFEEYTNGISLTSDNPTFSTAVVILTQTKGMLNLPDNVILLGYVKTDEGDDYLIEHLGDFIIFLKRLGIKHSIQHLAVVFSKEHYDTPTTSKMPK